MGQRATTGGLEKQYIGGTEQDTPRLRTILMLAHMVGVGWRDRRFQPHSSAVSPFGLVNKHGPGEIVD
jgi:hypothetical protein